jgi:hypothetical protein
MLIVDNTHQLCVGFEGEAENLDKMWVCQPGQAVGWQAM